MQADSLKKQLGQEGEAEAARFVEQQGFRILERNYRCRLGEIDLVAEKGIDLFFIEVKSRRTTDGVSPLELVPYPKQVHISKVAQYYFAKKRVEGKNGRFALVIVDYSGPSPACQLVPDIFDLAWGY